MRLARSLASALLLGSVFHGQEPALGIARLSAIRTHVRTELAQIPDYTCLETVSRYRGQASAGKLNALEPLDVVHLEVVYAGHKEWYGTPGDRTLSADNPAEFIGGGMIGSGAFAPTLHNAIEGGAFTYRGEEPVAGRTLSAFAFRLDRLSHGLEISIPGGAAAVGQEGVLWVDPKTLDPVRLETHASDIPVYLPLAGSETVIEFGRMKLQDRSVLLAQQATTELQRTSGDLSFDRFEFSHCRAYSAESSLRFDVSTPQVSAPQPEAPPAPALSHVPSNLAITIVVTSPITDSNAVGDPVEGRVEGNVSYKGAALVHDGATVHGRIRRLERYQEGGAFIVGIEFTEVLVAGPPLPFYADLLRLDKSPNIKIKLTEPIAVRTIDGQAVGTRTVLLREIPGVASFFVTGTKLALGPGLRTYWRTRGPIR